MICKPHHCLSADSFIFEKQQNLSIPLHVHACFEVIAVTEGNMTVQLDAKSYALEKGDAIFIFPYQAHSILTEGNCAYTLCIFSNRVISLFARNYSGKIPQDPVVHFWEHPLFETFTACQDQEDILKVKGILYLFFAELTEQTSFTEDRRQNNSDLRLFDRVFPYIEQHYTNKCSLMDAARELKYDYTYLSRVFSDFLGIPFHKYVINLRISDACYFLKNTQDTILEISQECGFSSLRSFNRNFSQFMNMTPSAYRTAQQSLSLERRTVQ